MMEQEDQPVLWTESGIQINDFFFFRLMLLNNWRDLF